MNLLLLKLRLLLRNLRLLGILRLLYNLGLGILRLLWNLRLGILRLCWRLLSLECWNLLQFGLHFYLFLKYLLHSLMLSLQKAIFSFFFWSKILDSSFTLLSQSVNLSFILLYQSLLFLLKKWEFRKRKRKKIPETIPWFC